MKIWTISKPAEGSRHARPSGSSPSPSKYHPLALPLTPGLHPQNHPKRPTHSSFFPLSLFHVSTMLFPPPGTPSPGAIQTLLQYGHPRKLVFIPHPNRVRDPPIPAPNARPSAPTQPWSAPLPQLDFQLPGTVSCSDLDLGAQTRVGTS